MISLPDVTLCAITTVNYELTLRAMRICMEKAKFGHAVILTDQPVKCPMKNVVLGGSRPTVDYSDVVCRRLAALTPTSHNLIVQWDSWITDEGCWSDEFLEYDYIGALWPWERKDFRMGNSGFCLRSRRLLEKLSHWDLPPIGTWVDDDFICKTIRTELVQKHGFRFAPDELAERFSRERGRIIGDTFGFHGSFNFHHHVCDGEMQNVIANMGPSAVFSPAFQDLVDNYRKAGKWEIVSLMERHRTNCSW